MILDRTARLMWLRPSGILFYFENKEYLSIYTFFKMGISFQRKSSFAPYKNNLKPRYFSFRAFELYCKACVYSFHS